MQKIKSMIPRDFPKVGDTVQVHISRKEKDADFKIEVKVESVLKHQTSDNYRVEVSNQAHSYNGRRFMLFTVNHDGEGKTILHDQEATIKMYMVDQNREENV